MVKTVRIMNFKYYSTFLSGFLGLFTLIIGVTNNNIPALILGLLFTVVSLYFYRQYSRYKLILTKGEFTEIWKHGTEKILFSQITELDCEIIKGAETMDIYPIFIYISSDGKSSTYKLHDEASIYEIVEWIKITYPECILSKSVSEVLSWKGYSRKGNQFLFGSKNK